MNFNSLLYENLYSLTSIAFLLITSLFLFHKYSKHKPSTNSLSPNNPALSKLKYQNNSYIVINDYASLHKLFSDIFINKYTIGIDTEYYRGLTYKGEICLFQISLQNSQKDITVYIIDVITIKKELVLKYNSIDLLKSVLKSVLENENIEKILHSLINDAEWIYQDFGIVLKNVFDTQYIYQNLNGGKIKIGLNELISKYFDVTIGKEIKKQFQLSNWKERPLTNDQLNYASQITFYLHELKDILSKELNETSFKLDELKANGDLNKEVNNWEIKKDKRRRWEVPT